MLFADFEARRGLHIFVVEVEIVILDLHDLDLRVRRQKTVEHFGRIMERHADVFDLSFCFQGFDDVEGMDAFVFFDVFIAHRVEQIEIEVIDAARFQLLSEERTDVLFRFEAV